MNRLARPTTAASVEKLFAYQKEKPLIDDLVARHTREDGAPSKSATWSATAACSSA